MCIVAYIIDLIQCKPHVLHLPWLPNSTHDRCALDPATFSFFGHLSCRGPVFSDHPRRGGGGWEAWHQEVVAAAR